MLIHLGMYLFVIFRNKKENVVFGQQSIRFTYSGDTSRAYLFYLISQSCIDLLQDKGGAGYLSRLNHRNEQKMESWCHIFSSQFVESCMFVDRGEKVSDHDFNLQTYVFTFN